MFHVGHLLKISFNYNVLFWQLLAREYAKDVSRMIQTLAL